MEAARPDAIATAKGKKMVDYYSQIESQEIDGVPYGQGDKISAEVDAGTIAYLAGIGLIGGPLANSIAPAPVDGEAKPLDKMTKAELVATAEGEGVTFADDVTNNEARVAAIEAARAAKAV